MEFVEAHEPQLLGYDFYIDDAGTSMTVIAIHLAAPGVDVLGPRAIGTDLLAATRVRDYRHGANIVGPDAGYIRATGTSFAAPLVAGVASLLIAANPSLDAAIDRVEVATTPRGPVARLIGTADTERLSFYPPGLRQAAHRHERAHMSIVIAGTLREVGAGRDEIGFASALTLRPYEFTHQVDFGPQGVPQAREAGVHRAHFARAFQHWFKAPPSLFRRHGMLCRAIAAVACGQSLALAAHGAGFADQSHLCRAMRSAIGTTPYRLLRRA